MIEITLEQARLMIATLQDLNERLDQEWNSELDDDQIALLKFLEQKATDYPGLIDAVIDEMVKNGDAIKL